MWSHGHEEACHCDYRWKTQAGSRCNTTLIEASRMITTQFVELFNGSIQCSILVCIPKLICSLKNQRYSKQSNEESTQNM